MSNSVLISTRWGIFNLKNTGYGLHSLSFPDTFNLEGGLNCENEKIAISEDIQVAISELQAYLNGELLKFSEFRIDLSGVSPFTKLILNICSKIPYAETWTYKQVAEAAGCPNAARAVGQALNRNRLPLFIPCHRVVSSSFGPKLGEILESKGSDEEFEGNIMRKTPILSQYVQFSEDKRRKANLPNELRFGGYNAGTLWKQRILRFEAKCALFGPSLSAKLSMVD